MELVIRPYQSADEEPVVALWERCGLVVPWNDPRQDIRKKIEFQPDLFLVGLLEERVVATAMVGYEGHRGWIQYLGVDPDYQKRGVGRQIVEAAETELRKLGCLKINLQVRRSNLGVIEFYQRLGFTLDEVESMGKRLDPPP